MRVAHLNITSSKSENKSERDVGSGRWGGETDLSVKQVDQLTLVELVGPKLNEGPWLKKTKAGLERWLRVLKALTALP